MTIHSPKSAEEAAEIVRSSAKIIPRGGGTKPALAQSKVPFDILDTSSIKGIVEYEPTEFTITAKAGTLISELDSILAENGQYLPFDPPWNRAKATLGGAIAAGVNGPSSLRYGGARDFVLGIQFITGEGTLAFSGGKVVKNAAGFDLPKFFVGSCGRFGVFTELTLKVFPKPESHATLIYDGNIESFIEFVQLLNQTPIEIDAIDWSSERMWVRLGGSPESLQKTETRIQQLLPKAPDEKWFGPESNESEFWQEARNFSWVADDESLLKLPCQIDDIGSIQNLLEKNAEHSVRYSMGGQVAYLAGPAEGTEKMSQQFNEELAMDTQLLVAKTDGCAPFSQTLFSEKIQKALDPNLRFAIDF